MILNRHSTASVKQKILLIKSLLKEKPYQTQSAWMTTLSKIVEIKI